MAKISFTKLGLKANQDIKILDWNGQNIEVKQYLPIQDKLKLIGDAINQSIEQDTDFANPVKSEMFMKMGIIEHYTNINFTDKQKDDIVKLYDMFEGTGLLKNILNAIPEEEYNVIWFGAKSTINAFYTYKNSVMGVLDTVTKDYSQTQLDAAEILNSLQNSKDLEMLKDLMPLIGQ